MEQTHQTLEQTINKLRCDHGDALQKVRTDHAAELQQLRKSHGVELCQLREFLESDSVPNSKVADKLSELARLHYNLVFDALSKLLKDVCAQTLASTDQDIAKLLDQFGEQLRTSTANTQLLQQLEQVWTETLERFDKQTMATHLKKSKQDAQTWVAARKKKLEHGSQERNAPLMKTFELQLASLF